jgi:hypothetical protein
MLIYKILSLGALGWHIGIRQTSFGVRKSLDKNDERKELKLRASDFFILYQVAINRLLCPPHPVPLPQGGEGITEGNY